MGTIATIALAVLGISFMVFVTFFGRLPIFRNTPVSFLYRLIWVYIPNAIIALDQRVTGGRVTSSLSRLTNYFLYERHPTVLIFFFLILSVSEYLFLPHAWPRISLTHKVCGTVSIILPYVFLYLAAATDPGYVTPANFAAQMALYPYDYTIFHPGQECRTCRLLKPARSKHCSFCKHCIAKCDHHCIFINNCVGYGNQHWFILLLLSTGVLAVYGAALGTSLTTESIREYYPSWVIWPAKDTTTLNEYLTAWSVGFQRHVGLGAVTFLAIMTAPLVWGMLGYHIYLIWCGTTTNESLKWSDWQEDMNDGLAFKRRMPENRPRNLAIEPAWTRWPLETVQIVVRTENGRPPRSDIPSIPGVGEWERVWKLRDVENLYDLGFWDNLMDVFVPNYDFNGGRGVEPITERRSRKRKKAYSTRFT